MPDLSLTDVVTNSEIQSAQVNNAWAAIESVVNALDDDNWAAGEIFPLDQLQQGGATTGQALSWDGSEWAPAPVGVLGYTRYAAGSTATLTTTSTSFVDIDATNLQVSFVAPASGKVIVTARLYTHLNVQVVVNLREASADIAGTEDTFEVFNGGAFVGTHVTHHAVTGLTAGASLTYKLGWKVFAGTGGVTVDNVSAAGEKGPAWIIVQQAL